MCERKVVVGYQASPTDDTSCADDDSAADGAAASDERPSESAGGWAVRSRVRSRARRVRFSVCGRSFSKSSAASCNDGKGDEKDGG